MVMSAFTSLGITCDIENVETFALSTVIDLVGALTKKVLNPSGGMFGYRNFNVTRIIIFLEPEHSTSLLYSQLTDMTNS